MKGLPAARRRRGQKPRRRTSFQKVARLAFVLAVVWVFLAGWNAATANWPQLLGDVVVAGVLALEAVKLRGAERTMRAQDHLVYVCASSLRVGIAAMKEMVQTGHLDDLVEALDRTGDLLDQWTLTHPDIQIRVQDVTGQS